MKKAKSLIKLLALSLAGVMCFGIAACRDNNGKGNSDPNQNFTPVPEVGIAIEEPTTTTLYKTYTATLKVTVTGTDDKAYFWNVTDINGAPSTVLTVSKEDVVSVATNVSADTPITVTATAHADTTKKASVTFTVKPTLSGENGDLNPDLFEEISGANLTVKGTLTDYYIDGNNKMNNDTTSYDMTVKMEENKWYGAWSRYLDGEIDTNNVVEQNYKMGDNINSSKFSSVHGHETLEVYVDKDNNSAAKVITDYNSVPVTWESKHLSNGFTYFGTNISDKYTYDTTNDVYKYVADFGEGEMLDNTDDAWQLTYLGIYFTPLLDETVVEMRLKVEDGKITTLYGRTADHVISTDSEGKPVQYEYTEIELHFSDAGTTAVPQATSYEAPANVNVLQNALTKMKAAENYTFVSVEHAMSAPQPDEGDYTVDMALTVSNDVVNTAYSNHTAGAGTVGRKGWVTKGIILFEDTMEYSAYSGDPYSITYKGYKNRSEANTYENFEFENGKLTGQRMHSGTLQENVFPKFEFSPNLFKFGGKETVDLGKGQYEDVYKFVLRNTAVTRDISKEISLWTYAGDATAMAFATLTLWVTEDGNLYQTLIPYSYASGNYTGYVTTTFSKIGSTKLDAADFSGDNYAERVVKMNWTEYVTKDYSPNTHSNLDEDDNADTNTVLEHLFGNGWDSFIPQPKVFINILGDMLSGPWFDYNVKGTDADGNANAWYDHFDFTVGDRTADYVDENSKIIDVESFLGPNGSFAQALATLGYTYSQQNSGYSHGSYYGCYINTAHNVLIKVDNIGTAFFYFEVYNDLNAWHLSRD